MEQRSIKKVSWGQNCFLLQHYVKTYINQLLSIMHEGLEVRSVFLDIPKAFDKVWHKGIIFKLSQNGISGNLLDNLLTF